MYTHRTQFFILILVDIDTLSITAYPFEIDLSNSLTYYVKVKPSMVPRSLRYSVLTLMGEVLQSLRANESCLAWRGC